MMKNPWKIIALGFILVLLGFLVPMLMIVQAIEASLFLSFASHVASVAGLFLGIVGASAYSRRGKHKRR
jgi:hypothetical protein